MTSRQTRFSDVCGTMDELRRLVHEESERSSIEPERVIGPLLEDAFFMLRRMKKRLDEYDAFREEVREMLSNLDAVEVVDLDKAHNAIALIRTMAHSGEKLSNTHIRTIGELAEDIRSVASAQEHRLRSYKDLALKLHERFVAVQGNRAWVTREGEAESRVDAVKRRYQAWLPPERHGRMLLERIGDGKAHILDELLPDGQPVVQFTDGGNMAMSEIRWDPAIGNFHDASFKPAPTARKYRSNSPGTDRETADG